jgi:hypothetical protein
MLHVHACAKCLCQCCISKSMLHFPGQCCMIISLFCVSSALRPFSIPMHVYVAYQPGLSMLNSYSACPSPDASCHFHADYPSCISVCRSILHANAGCPCCMSLLHVHAARQCCMSMMLVHHARPFCMSMLHVRASFPCLMSLSAHCMSMLFVHPTCPCCMLQAASPFCMSMLHVRGVCTCCLSMLHYLPKHVART